VLLIGAVLSRRRAERLSVVGLLPVVLPGALAFGVVMLGKDLGTSMIVALIVLAGLFFSGVRPGPLLVVVTIAGACIAILAQVGGSRTDRVGTWLHGCGNADVLGTCWQSQQAIWALANGGLFGVGIGNSVSKWFWLPEADNDFILAVIGEETGLLGLLVLLVLFVALAVVALRVVVRTRDRFTRAVAGMAIAWLVGQAFANIAVVLGIMPVFGVPLPFVSAGGSSMIANLLAVGALMALANVPRDEQAPPPPSGLRPAPVRGGSA
jgi:cell division protein FtsW